MIGHGGLLRAFSFPRPIRGSGPRSSRTFEEYATFDVLSTIQARYAKHNRTDIRVRRIQVKKV